MLTNREALYIGGGPSALFALHWPGMFDRPPILFLPPLLEEMNKSRAAMNQIARAVQEIGCAALLCDWYGTGDSQGLLEDTGWEQWRDDVRSARDWLEGIYRRKPIMLAIRGGALLLPDHVDCSWLLCAPIWDGNQQLTQWIRTRLMSSRMAGQSETSEDLMARIADHGLEVGGYLLTALLVEPMREVQLPEVMPSMPTCIFEIGTGEAPSPNTSRVVTRWSSEWRRVDGPLFWQTAEIETCPELAQELKGQLSQWLK